MSEHTARSYIFLLGLTIASFFEGIWNSVVDAIDSIFNGGILKITYGIAVLHSLVYGILFVSVGSLSLLGLPLYAILNSVVVGTALTGVYFIGATIWNMVSKTATWIGSLFAPVEKDTVKVETIFEEGGFGAYEVTREPLSTFKVAA